MNWTLRPKAAPLLHLSPAEIRPNPAQPRRRFDDEGLASLAESIRQYGILQPLAVRKTAGGYELVAGERRLRAARLAGLKTVPCLLVEAEERRSALLALVENLQREDLHYLEEAAAMARLIREHQLSQEEVARELGYSQPAVANKLRLLRLSPACAALLRQSGLSERHARAALRLEDDEQRLAALRHMAERQLTVAQSEQYVEQLLRQLPLTPPRRRSTYIIKDVRLFLNSVDRGLRLIREAGVGADCQRKDTEDAILLTIRIPRCGGQTSRAGGGD